MKISSVENVLKKQKYSLNELINLTYQSRTPWALWKLPGKNNPKNFITGRSTNLTPPLDLQKLTPGFLIHPFMLKKNQPAQLIFADLHTEFFDHKNIHITYDNNYPKLKDFFKNNYQQTPSHPHSYFTSSQTTDVNDDATSINHFKNMVKEAIISIERGEFDKVVPSRIKIHPLKAPFDISNAFIKLCDTYPEAFVYCVSTPEIGTWMGASPELLIDINENTFKTVSLAGTQANTAEISPTNVAWTQKEIEEQAMVSRFIINCFKKIRLREFNEKGPRTVVAGNLLHLKTDYTVDLSKVAFPELGSVMLNLLHPTSATCGMPKASALAFLEKHEKYNRSYYSGFLGPVNIKKTSTLFVNLRCMQLSKKHLTLYAGAGVTRDSNPEKEWQETVLKCNTLLNIVS